MKRPQFFQSSPTKKTNQHDDKNKQAESLAEQTESISYFVHYGASQERVGKVLDHTFDALRSNKKNNGGPPVTKKNGMLLWCTHEAIAHFNNLDNHYANEQRQDGKLVEITKLKR